MQPFLNRTDKYIINNIIKAQGIYSYLYISLENTCLKIWVHLVTSQKYIQTLSLKHDITWISLSLALRDSTSILWFFFFNKDATQKFLEQIDVIHQIVEKYPGQ